MPNGPKTGAISIARLLVDGDHESTVSLQAGK